MAEGGDAACYPLAVDYCGVCSMPPEVRRCMLFFSAHLSSDVGRVCCVQYCEYAPEPAKCYDWMKANLPDHYSRIEESRTCM